MKTQVRKFNKLINLNIIDPDLFYTMTIDEYGIVFQGKYSHDMIKKLSLFKFALGDNNYIEASRNGIEIVLT